MKVNNTKTSSKTYWSIQKTLYNGEKVPFIPPPLVNTCPMSDLKAKASLFNSSLNLSSSF